MSQNIIVINLIFYTLIRLIPPEKTSQVSWGCGIHWLHLYRGVTPPPNKCPRYDTKQYDGEASVMLLRMQSTPSLPSFPGPLWPGVVAPDWVLSMGQIELFEM